MAANTQLASLEEVICKSREQYARSIELAETRLEAARQAHADTIRQSSEAIAALESHLEMLDAFEQERRAALCRTELAAACEQHKQTVDTANWRLKEAMSHYVKMFTAAGMAMECAFNAAAGRRE